MKETIIEIPGIFLARVVNGRIIGYTFTPRAADAGYFGEATYHVDGPEIDQETFFQMISPTLMNSSDNQSATFSCEWVE